MLTNNLQPIPLVLLGRDNIFPRLGKVCLRQWEMSNVIFLQQMDRCHAAAESLSLTPSLSLRHTFCCTCSAFPWRENQNI